MQSFSTTQLDPAINDAQSTLSSSSFGDTRSIGSLSVSVRQVAKIDELTPSRMRPTCRSLTAEWAVMLAGISVCFAHVYFVLEPLVYYPIAFIWIIIVSTA